MVDDPQMREDQEGAMGDGKVASDPDGVHPDDGRLAALYDKVQELIERLQEAERRFAAVIDSVDARYRESARNLVHYVAIRHVDLRELQIELARWGLSSLGRMEAHVMETLQAVASVLDRLAGQGHEPLEAAQFGRQRALLDARSADLFGEAADGKRVRIMVTLPAESAGDSDLIRQLVEAGTDCVRINCAKDDASAWRRMVDLVRRAEIDTGRSCRILMDLAGPKPRTGALRAGPKVTRWKPRRDVTGKVTSPARVAFVPAMHASSPAGDSDPKAPAADTVLPVGADWLRRAEAGDSLELRDARGKKRRLDVVKKQPGGIVAESDQTGYVTTGTSIRRIARGGEGAVSTSIGELPAVEVPIVLQTGDLLILHAGESPGRPALRAGDKVDPARVSCTAPELFEDLRPGEPVKFDDGKIEGVIESVSADEVTVRITLARERGSKLRADKGINFPESRLKARGLTPKDYRDLDFIVKHADLVGLSFAESREGVRALQQALVDRDAAGIGIMLKIETRRGFSRLPHLILEAMKSYPISVMIARGDLAVECGWERTAEVQEEILWMCEAAHVPVVWATQVLEGLANSGIPSRAEITDAAMAERAECVMLNKGPYILTAIRSLSDVLTRMGGHQTKKTPLLRYLKLTDMMIDEAV
jgi:pyruvate kinase